MFSAYSTEHVTSMHIYIIDYIAVFWLNEISVTNTKISISLRAQSTKAVKYEVHHGL